MVTEICGVPWQPDPSRGVYAQFPTIADPVIRKALGHLVCRYTDATMTVQGPVMTILLTSWSEGAAISLCKMHTAAVSMAHDDDMSDIERERYTDLAEAMLASPHPKSLLVYRLAMSIRDRAGYGPKS